MASVHTLITACQAAPEALAEQAQHRLSLWDNWLRPVHWRAKRSHLPTATAPMRRWPGRKIVLISPRHAADGCCAC